MCGWCYAFMPVIQRLQHNLSGEYNFVILSGGMVMGDNVGPFGERADYIHQASQRVQHLSGVEFGEDFYRNILFNPEYQNNSEPPCLALTAFKQFANNSEQHFAFAHRMQVLHYQQGVDLNKESVYSQLAEEFGLNFEEFLSVIKSPRTKSMMYKEFLHVSELGATGFPTTILENEGKVRVLAEGYADYETLLRILKNDSPQTIGKNEDSTCDGSK